MIQKVIDVHITKKHEVGNEERTALYAGKLAVSDAGKCRLMRWNKLHAEVVEPHPPEVLRIFEVGNIYHEYIQDIMRKRGIMEYCEYRMTDKHRVGHLDMIINIGGKRVLYDIKTCNAKSFDYKTPNKIDKHHKHQILTYYQMFKAKHPDIEVDECKMLYVRKDDFTCQEIRIPITEETLMDVDSDWFAMIKAKRDGKEPEANPQHWECRYCVFNTQCEFSNYKE